MPCIDQIPLDVVNHADLRYWRRVQKTDSCWLWLGRLDRDGYGDFAYYYRGRQCQVRAHHAAWYYATGKWPCTEVLMHTCDVPHCVRPEHLRPGTHRDNVDDKLAKQRQCIGSRHGHAKLNEDSVRDIRSSTLGVHELAAKYGVQAPAIYKVRNGTRWRHLV